MEDDRDNLAQTQAEFGDYEELDRDLTAKSDELKSKQQALEKLQKGRKSCVTCKRIRQLPNFARFAKAS